MKVSKKEQKRIEEREKFLQVYADLRDWLYGLGFEIRVGDGDVRNYHYGWYNDFIDPMGSVLHYAHPVLQLSVRFIEDRNEHKVLVTGELGAHSGAIPIEEFKRDLLETVTQLRDNKIKELQAIGA